MYNSAKCVATGCPEGAGEEKPRIQGLGYLTSIISLLGGIANELRLRARLTCLYCGSEGSTILSPSMQTKNHICGGAFAYLASNHAILLLP